MKTVAFSIIGSCWIYASNAIHLQPEVVEYADGGDLVTEEADELAEEGQEMFLNESGPLFDWVRGVVGRSQNGWNQSHRSVKEAAAKVAVLAREASAKAEAELREWFRRSEPGRNLTGPPNASRSPARPVNATKANISSAKHYNISLAKHGNASARRGNVTLAKYGSTTVGNATAQFRNATATEAKHEDMVMGEKQRGPYQEEETAKAKNASEAVAQRRLRRSRRQAAALRTSAAVGDPHMTNIRGQRFDLAQLGEHTLVVIPRFASLVADTLFRVRAEVQRVGLTCEDIYIKTLNVTGTWVDAARMDGLIFRAGIGNRFAGQWMHLGKVQLKVVNGVTQGGLAYLNFFARNLGHTGLAVGGLLGEDDHTAAATPGKGCSRTMSLLAGSSAEDRKDPERSMAQASLLQVPGERSLPLPGGGSGARGPTHHL